jgi:hypothetical protein
MSREKVLYGKEEIIRVAVEIVDREGIDALSARRISKELGISSMTIYNYVENLSEVKKLVLCKGFDRLYDSVYQSLTGAGAPMDKKKFCKIIAFRVFVFAEENKNIFTFMFAEGRYQFSEDAEVRPFYNFITKLTKRAIATAEDWANNEKCYKLLEFLTFAMSSNCASGISNMSKVEYTDLIDFFLEKCIS